MARTESRTKTAIWSDADFRKLTKDAQRMYWLLYSQPTITLCGVVALTVRRWEGTASDETEEEVYKAVAELAAAGFVLVDRGTEELLVRSFVKHDGVARSPKTLQAAWDQLGGISSPLIREAAERQLRDMDTPPHTVSDTPSEPVDNTVSDTPPDRPRTRVRAVSVSSLLSPSPSPVSAPVNGNGTCSNAAETETKPAMDVASRIMAICTADSRDRVRREAAAVAAWASPVVDVRIIDEALWWFTAHERPALPRAVAGLIRSKASDRNINLPEFRPPP